MKIRARLLVLTAFVLVSAPATWVHAAGANPTCTATGGSDPYSHEKTYYCTEDGGKTKRLCGAADIKDKRAGCGAPSALVSNGFGSSGGPAIGGNKTNAIQVAPMNKGLADKGAQIRH